MRDSYRQQLEALHTELIRMGALCEEAISGAVTGLVEKNPGLRAGVEQLERDIDFKEREIESLCVRLLLREQPVAGDLRQITAAQGMICDMERIGDQAADIAALAEHMDGGAAASGVHIAEMARAAAKMLTDSVDSFVAGDVVKARGVPEYDDVVDELFAKIRDELIARITEDALAAPQCLDLFMIAKYLERIGDHAANIAEWVNYSVTGKRTFS
ncbi:MAG: phosphate signaling complex protein PhoU [Oscillospiraceae bacterium]|jgi:phosphate transport system protein|nr:phosphate signaling complex protein PhoU [Oscillospiraceae bacterium]